MPPESFATRDASSKSGEQPARIGIQHKRDKWSRSKIWAVHMAFVLGAPNHRWSIDFMSDAQADV